MPLPQKLAVAIAHGIGLRDPDFADGMTARLKARFAQRLRGATDDPAAQLVVQPVYWAPVVQDREDTLWARLSANDPLDFVRLRRFLANYASDAIAYQRLGTPGEAAYAHDSVYDHIHAIFATALGELARQAGPRAPLCVVGYSLGSVIASNYFWDLQRHNPPAKVLIAPQVEAAIDRQAPLERGETLALFYTVGSPLALWGLRYEDFGHPIAVPAPQLSDHLPGLSGEWVNFYDKDDVIGWPLRPLNDAYQHMVRADWAVPVGSLWTGWSPLAHTAYLTDRHVTDPIADKLAEVWLAVNA